MQKRGGGFLLGGETLCYMDFHFFETLLFIGFLTNEEIYQVHPILGQFKGQMAELPYLSSYLESEDKAVSEYPYLMRFAPVNNW